MRNTTTTARKRRFSIYLAQKKSVQNFEFLRENKGSMRSHKLASGNFKVTFSSSITGRNAFAYGCNFQRAYSNLIKLFNLKYS